MDIAQRWFAIDEAVREIDRLQAFHDSIVLAQWKGKDIEKLQSQIRGQITRLKRRAGLIGSSDKGFAEFFLNWVEVGDNFIRTVEQRRGHLRWILRMLRTPVIDNSSNG